MLFSVEKGIREEMCDPIHLYGKANNEYIKECNRHILNIEM